MCSTAPSFFLNPPQQEIVEVLPYLLFQHIAVYLLVADAPALLADAPADHLHLEAVVLHVHTGCQHQHSLRHVCVVQLSPVQQRGILPRGLVELRFDAALALNDRRGDDHRLFVPKGRLSLLGQG